MRNEQPTEPGGLSAIIVIVAMSFVVGVGLGWFIVGDTGPALNPVAAYCRGYSDGVGKVLLDQGTISLQQYAEGAPLLDLECAEDVKSAAPQFTDVLRGPLTVEAP